MAGINLLPFFLTGLLGSVHCVGMCGGIVSAFSLAPAKPWIPIRPSGSSAASPAWPNAVMSDLSRSLAYTLAYNLGRIGSYALAGSLAGGLAAGLAGLPGLAVTQRIAYVASNLLLIAVGLYLAGIWPYLARVERVGKALWQRVQPLSKYLLPLDSLWKLLLLGGIWGWLPCGMVYSSLVIAALSGSATHGALIMLAFGAGTLPMLLATGLLGSRLKNVLQRPPVRLAAGFCVLGFGVLGLLRAADGTVAGWLLGLCMSRGA